MHTILPSIVSSTFNQVNPNGTATNGELLENFALLETFSNEVAIVRRANFATRKTGQRRDVIITSLRRGFRRR